MRATLDEYFGNLVKLVATRSTCIRRKVGAIIVDRKGRVLSTGYNGVPRGLPHCIDAPCIGANDTPGNSDRCWAVHAEMNAILQCNSVLERAHTLYTTASPCFNCCKVICNTSITRVVSLEAYPDTYGLMLLRQAEIDFDLLKPPGVP